MTRAITATIVAAAALAAVASCADPHGLERQRAQFEQYAQPPVESFTYLGHYRRWQLLGNGRFVVWTTTRSTSIRWSAASPRSARWTT